MAEPSATAQDAYRLMLREHIAPALRGLGFRRGPGPGVFRYATATHAAKVRFMKSRLSTRQEVSFGAGLHALELTTGRDWFWTLDDLAHRSYWRIKAGGPVKPVADSVLRAFRGYGWQAIQAALDDPGFPPDPAARWARTFPRLPDRPLSPEEDKALWRTRSAVYHTSEWPGNETFASLEILEKDPIAGERESAALRLIPVAGTTQVSQALRSAAAEDEDAGVRWAARYALRLAAPDTCQDG